MTETVRVARTGTATTITLNRPRRLNALDAPTVDALGRALEDAAEDDDTRAVVVTGAGRGFCAGGDLRSLAAASGSVPWSTIAARVRASTRIAELLRGMPKLTIAAVKGPCAGAGLSLACAADVRLAAASARFVPAFLDASQPGDYGIAWTLPRIVGAGRARRILLAGDAIDADDALRIGLVSEVVPDAQLADRARELAEAAAR